MLNYMTAGESHGPALLAILEGFPAGVPLSAAFINQRLARRQGGFGRGGRMRIEKDEVQLLAGVRGGESLGSPIGMLVENRDFSHWHGVMGADAATLDAAKRATKAVTRPRPGHADLVGGLKYDRVDLRDILERASARETTMRVAVGACAQALLEPLGISVAGHVVQMGGVAADEALVADLSAAEVAARSAESPVFCADQQASEAMVEAVKRSAKSRDTLGGVVEVVADGLPVGLGTHTTYHGRLDARLAQALMSIQAMKGVEIGLGFRAAALPGSLVHDPIAYVGPGMRPRTGGYSRTRNGAGGLEGGISNGERLWLRVAMKPLATLLDPLPTVEVQTKEPAQAVTERSDVTAVPAASVVAEAMVAFVLAQAVLEKFGGDSLTEVQRNLHGYLAQVAQR